MRTLMVAATAAALLTGGSASAAGLGGQTAQLEWLYAPTGFHSTTAVLVGPGPELSDSWVSGGTVDLADTSVYVAFLNDSVGVIGLASEVVWRFSGDFSSFAGLTTTTNFIGWNDSWATLTSGGLTVEFASTISMPRNQGFITFALTPVPEPSVAAMLIAGLCALSTLPRRSRAERFKPSMNRGEAGGA